MLAVALLGTNLMGCGVLSTNDQCKEIAEVLDRSQAALAEPLATNPPAAQLEARADTYRDLGAQLKRLRLDKELDKNRDVLVKHLQTVVQHLNHAADAVAQAAKDNPAAETAPANSAAPPPANQAQGPSAGTQRARQRSQLRRYLQAKTEIEAASARIAETMHKLSVDCH